MDSRPAIRARTSLSAPTYYIAVSARPQDAQHVRFEGASNVPPGAKISVNVAKFSGYGWTRYSADSCISVNDEGLFAGQLTQKPGLEFPPSGDLVVAATFQTNLCRPQATPVSFDTAATKSPRKVLKSSPRALLPAVRIALYAPHLQSSCDSFSDEFPQHPCSSS